MYSSNYKDIQELANVRDRYRLVKMQNKQTAQEVVLKIFNPQKVFNGEEYVQNLTDLKKLTGPNIVRILEFQEKASNQQVVTEYCNEDQLKEFINKNNILLREKMALDILVQVLKGVKEMINAGVINLDPPRHFWQKNWLSEFFEGGDSAPS